MDDNDERVPLSEELMQVLAGAVADFAEKHSDVSSLDFCMAVSKALHDVQVNILLSAHHPGPLARFLAEKLVRDVEEARPEEALQ
jgi:hypothetical protein